MFGLNEKDVFVIAGIKRLLKSDKVEMAAYLDSAGNYLNIVSGEIDEEMQILFGFVSPQPIDFEAPNLGLETLPLLLLRAECIEFLESLDNQGASQH